MMVEVEITIRKNNNNASCQHCTKYLGITYPQLNSSWGKKEV